MGCICGLNNGFSQWSPKKAMLSHITFYNFAEVHTMNGRSSETDFSEQVIQLGKELRQQTSQPPYLSIALFFLLSCITHSLTFRE